MSNILTEKLTSLQLEKQLLGGLYKHHDCLYEIEPFFKETDLCNKTHEILYSLLKQAILNERPIYNVHFNSDECRKVEMKNIFRIFLKEIAEENAKQEKTPEELKRLRELTGLTIAEMARQLETPLRTYQDWEAGVCRVPGIAFVAVKSVGKTIDCAMCKVKRGIAERIAADFPRGFLSA